MMRYEKSPNDLPSISECHPSKQQVKLDHEEQQNSCGISMLTPLEFLFPTLLIFQKYLTYSMTHIFNPELLTCTCAYFCITVLHMCLFFTNNSPPDSQCQKYSRLRCYLHVKSLVICFYLGWCGSILQFKQNMIKVQACNKGQKSGGAHSTGWG